MHLVFLGPPACGKGTQSEILVKKYGYHHLSTGDILRKESASGSELGNLLKLTLANGALAPTDLVNKAIKKDIEKYSKNSILLMVIRARLIKHISLTTLLLKQMAK